MANNKSNQKKSSPKKRSKLLFVPVQKVRRHLIEHNYANRIARNAPIALIAVMEYLTTELLTLAGKIAMKSKLKRIKPRHIQLAIRLDSEFKKLLKWATIADGGVLPTVK